MSWYLKKENEFLYITVDDNGINIIYGDTEKNAAIAKKTPMKKSIFRKGKIKKYIDGCKKQGYNESNETFNPESIEIIGLDPYQITDCNWFKIFTNSKNNQFWEIGIKDLFLFQRQGITGGLGSISKMMFKEKKYAENHFFKLIEQKKKEGYKSYSVSSPYFSLSQVLKDLNEIEKKEKQKIAALEEQKSKQEKEQKEKKIKQEVFLTDYKRRLAEGPLTEKFMEWPVCLNHLEPMNRDIQSKLPDFIREAFKLHGVANEQDMFIPIRIVSLLGKCLTNQFVSCPNMPEYYFDKRYEYLGESVEDIIKNNFEVMSKLVDSEYYWFDCELLDKNKKVIPLRFVYNCGDADSNEGFYGAVWQLETKELVADIISSGDCETTIKSSVSFAEKFCSHNIWLPLLYDKEKYNSMIMQSVLYKQGNELEKLIHIIIMIHWHSIANDGIY